MSYRKTAHSVYDLKYHDVYIVKGHVLKDHVHLSVSVPPNLTVSELVKSIESMIRVASLIRHIDYWRRGRTVEKLGLEQ